MVALVDLLDHGSLTDNGAVGWGCPVPFFGDISGARVATVGINPSNREFMDVFGAELRGAERRFPTLGSLGLHGWGDATSSHLAQIIDSCATYFGRNPFDNWFGRLDVLLSHLDVTYYSDRPSACHLDIVPYATHEKWGRLPARVRSMLIDSCCASMASVLESSSISLLILNGRSVVHAFERLTGVVLEASPMPDSNLHRRGAREVSGVSYHGSLSDVLGLRLARSIQVLGYNHNLQGSFGVSRRVVSGIGSWLVDSAVD